MAFTIVRPSSSRSPTPRNRRALRFGAGQGEVASPESRKSKVRRAGSTISRRSTLSLGGKEGFRSLYELHAALDKWTDIDDKQRVNIWNRLPREIRGLGEILSRRPMTFEDVVDAGVISKDRAAKYQSELAWERRMSNRSARSGGSRPAIFEAGSRGYSDELTMWELCDLVSRPDFKFSDTAISPIPTDSSSSEEDEPEAPDLKRDETLVFESSFMRQKAMDKLKKGVCKMQLLSLLNSPSKSVGDTDGEGSRAPSSVKTVLPLSRAFAARTPSPAKSATDLNPSNSMVQRTSVGSNSRVREPLLIVEGAWDVDKCGGTDTAQNPQVQMRTERVTLLTVELMVRGACGSNIQIWVLRGCQWGLRKPKLVNVLHSVSSSGPHHGPRQLFCECELPPDEVITLVLACDGNEYEKGVERRRKKDDEKHVSESSSVLQGKYSALKTSSDVNSLATAMVYQRCAREAKATAKADSDGQPIPSAHLSRLFLSTMIDDFNKNASTSESPSFKLAILTRSPFAEGPQLLLPVRKANADLEASSHAPQKANADAPRQRDRAASKEKLRLPNPRASVQDKVDASERKEGSPRSSCDKEEVVIDPEVIPGFVKLYLNAGSRLEDKMAISAERFSARLGRVWRLTSYDERKKVYWKSAVFCGWKRWYRFMLSLGPSARCAERLKDIAREKRFGKAF